MPFRWPPPAFPVVVLLALVVIPTAVLGGYSRSQAPWVWLAAALLGAIILAVIAQWAMHRDGVYDWQHGGVVDLRTEAGDSVRLIDLASRGLQGNTQGFIDRLERRVNECVAAIQRAPRRAS